MRCASPIAHSNFQPSIQFLVEYNIVYGKIIVLHISLVQSLHSLQQSPSPLDPLVPEL